MQQGTLALVLILIYDCLHTYHWLHLDLSVTGPIFLYEKHLNDCDLRHHPIGFICL